MSSICAASTAHVSSTGSTRMRCAPLSTSLAVSTKLAQCAGAAVRTHKAAATGSFLMSSSKRCAMATGDASLAPSGVPTCWMISSAPGAPATACGSSAGGTTSPFSSFHAWRMSCMDSSAVFTCRHAMPQQDASAVQQGARARMRRSAQTRLPPRILQRACSMRARAHRMKLSDSLACSNTRLLLPLARHHLDTTMDAERARSRARCRRARLLLQRQQVALCVRRHLHAGRQHRRLR